MTDQPTLQDALRDVRRAFRLLWYYQERVLDIVRAVAGEFQDSTFYYCVPHNITPADRYNPQFTRNPWHSLPLMNASYLYKVGGNSTKITAGDWFLDVRIISDSGYDEGTSYRENLDPSTFGPPETTDSMINLYLFYCTDDIDGNFLKGVYERLEWPDPDGEPSPAAGLPVTVVGRSWDLATLSEKERVQAAAREFKQAASAALEIEIA
jgi:hypothetical protein